MAADAQNVTLNYVSDNWEDAIRQELDCLGF